MLRHKFFGQIKHEISRELYVYTFGIRDSARSRGFKKRVLFIKTVASRIQNVHTQAFTREFLYY